MKDVTAGERNSLRIAVGGNEMSGWVKTGGEEGVDDGGAGAKVECGGWGIREEGEGPVEVLNAVGDGGGEMRGWKVKVEIEVEFENGNGEMVG